MYKLFSILKRQIFCYEIFKILIEILYFLFFIHFEKYANEDKSISLPSCVWFGLVWLLIGAELQWWATVTVTAPSEVWVCCVVVEAFYFVCCPSFFFRFIQSAVCSLRCCSFLNFFKAPLDVTEKIKLKFTMAANSTKKFWHGSVFH